MTAETKTHKSSSANKMPNSCEVFGFIHCSSVAILFVWSLWKINFCIFSTGKILLAQQVAYFLYEISIWSDKSRVD